MLTPGKAHKTRIRPTGRMLLADRLYQMYREELLTEEVLALPWAVLDPAEQIAWGKFCRRLQREHGLEK